MIVSQKKKRVSNSVRTGFAIVRMFHSCASWNYSLIHVISRFPKAVSLPVMHIHFPEQIIYICSCFESDGHDSMDANIYAVRTMDGGPVFSVELPHTGASKVTANDCVHRPSVANGS